MSEPHRTDGLPWLFITGSSRAGTELLRGILNRHSCVFVAHETHYFADLRPRISGQSGAEATAAALQYFVPLRGSTYGLGGAETDRPATELYAELAAAAGVGATPDAVFCAHCRLSARDAGKHTPQLWGEKTPRHIFDGAAILKTLPSARVVHMVRDPRAAIASYLDWQNHWYDGREISHKLGIGLAAEAQRVKATSSLTALALSWRAAAATACTVRSESRKAAELRGIVG